MNHRFSFLLLVGCLVVPGGFSAQSNSATTNRKEAAGAKTPADGAFDAFNQIRTARGARPDQAGFQKVISAGTAFLLPYPTDERAAEVVQNLAFFGHSMTAEDQEAFRSAYLAQLRFEIVNQRYKEGLGAEAAVALAALEAAAMEAEVREGATDENVNALRRKIDALTAMPGSGRFLIDRERGYFEILTHDASAEDGEAHLKHLLTHPDAGVAAMARAELNLIEIRGAPYELKFTALDGKEFDFARLRGKAVLVVFWATTNEAATRELTALKSMYGEYRSRGLEIVAVSYDRAADRESVTKFVQSNKVVWPVYFDGTEDKNAAGQKLNVHVLPAMALFDRKGMLVATGLQPNRVESEIKKLLGVQDDELGPAQAQQKTGKRKKR